MQLEQEEEVALPLHLLAVVFGGVACDELETVLAILSCCRQAHLLAEVILRPLACRLALPKKRGRRTIEDRERVMDAPGRVAQLLSSLCGITALRADDCDWTRRLYVGLRYAALIQSVSPRVDTDTKPSWDTPLRDVFVPTSVSLEYAPVCEMQCRAVKDMAAANYRARSVHQLGQLLPTERAEVTSSFDLACPRRDEEFRALFFALTEKERTTGACAADDLFGDLLVEEDTGPLGRHIYRHIYSDCNEGFRRACFTHHEKYPGALARRAELLRNDRSGRTQIRDWLGEK